LLAFAITSALLELARITTVPRRLGSHYPQEIRGFISARNMVINHPAMFNQGA